MKKTIAVLLSVLLTAAVFVGCNVETQTDRADIKVVATIFPIYDWVHEVAQDDVDINIDMLLDNGVDLHSYQPTAKDIMDIADCDIFVYVGGESDAWVADVLDQANNDNMIVLDLLDILGDKVKEEELVEGMQEDEHDHEHEEAEEEEHDHEEGPEYDEHVWLSLKNVSIFVDRIADSLATVDARHADVFRANAAAYDDKIAALDAQYQEAVDNASVKTLLFGDRFPFRYLTDDYGLDYYAAFVGCSAETEASFETILFLANKVDELELKSILQIESADGSIAETIRDNTKTKDQQILTLDSIQSVTADRVQAGESYLSIMQNNLETLKQALQ